MILAELLDLVAKLVKLVAHGLELALQVGDEVLCVRGRLLAGVGLGNGTLEAVHDGAELVGAIIEAGGAEVLHGLSNVFEALLEVGRRLVGAGFSTLSLADGPLVDFLGALGLAPHVGLAAEGLGELALRSGLLASPPKLVLCGGEGALEFADFAVFAGRPLLMEPSDALLEILEVTDEGDLDAFGLGLGRLVRGAEGEGAGVDGDDGESGGDGAHDFLQLA